MCTLQRINCTHVLKNTYFYIKLESIDAGMGIPMGIIPPGIGMGTKSAALTSFCGTNDSFPARKRIGSHSRQEIPHCHLGLWSTGMLQLLSQDYK
jgi:hypothetical protein